MTSDYDSLYIGGKWRTPASEDRIEVCSAATEERIGSVPAATVVDVDAAVDAARNAFDDPTGWSTWLPRERADVLRTFASEMKSRAKDIVTAVSSQNGMPVGIGRFSEGAVPAKMLRYYADMVEQTPASEMRISLIQGRTEVRRVPVGVVGAIVPWNFPQILTFFKLAPALAAGCAVVLKPSSETVLDAMLIAEAAEAAGLPAGVLNVAPGPGRTAGARLVEHPGIDKIAFTGSTAAGRSIAETCGRQLKPVTLELGGKSAAIILDDADLSTVMAGLFAVTLINQGQGCYLCTRILAPRSRYQEVVDAVTDMAKSLKIGDPLDPSTMIGPVASSAQRDTVESYIAKGLAEGGQVTTGGGRPSGFDRGWYVEPTVFAGLDNSAVVSREEIFGPVLTIIEYADDDDAVRIANDSDYGLAGTVWTRDLDRGIAVAGRIQSGSVGVNGYTMDHGAPFGGLKDSGIGRELGPEGLAAYQQYKSLYLP